MNVTSVRSLALWDPEGAVRHIRRRIPRSTVICFISTFILGMLIHSYMFTNKFPNLDDLWYVLGSDYGVASGRWLLPSVLKLDGNLSMPWLIGLLSVLFLSFSACLTTAVLRISRTLPCILTGAIMVSFPTVTANFTYMFSADAYILSLLLASLGAYLTVKYRFGFIGGAIALTLSLGIYQSYLGVAAVLLVGALILETLDGEKTAKQLLLKGIKYLLTIAAGLALYYIIVKLTTRTEELVEYMGLSSMGQIPPTKLPQLILRAYESYYDFFIFDYHEHYFKFMSYAFLALGAASLVIGILILKTRRLKVPQLFMLALLLILVPLAAAIIYVTSTDDFVHELMIYGLCFILIAPLVAYEYLHSLSPGGLKSISGGISCWVVLGVLALTVYNHAVLSNQTYLHQQFTYEQTASFSTRLISDIESFEGYDKSTEVVLMGKVMTDVAPEDYPEPEPPYLTGSLNSRDFINSYSYGNFLRYFMCLPNEVLATESPLAKELYEDAKYDLIPCYPADGSIFMEDGRIVVKLSQYPR